MQFLQSLNRKTLTVSSLVIAALFLFFLNVLSNGEIRSAQVDLTQSKLFTLSEGTKNILNSIREPLTFRFYFSRKFGEISPAHGNYAKRVRELLETFKSAAGGKINLKIINPEAFSVEEDEAVKLGIQGVPLDQSGENGYFGLAATNSTDDRQSVAFFNPQREQFLEYDITRMIFALAQPKKKKIGLMTSLLLEADPMTQYQPWPIMRQITQFFEVKSLDPDVKEIDDNIQVLLLIHPKITSKATMYAIDQFIMRGGRAVILVDPHNETARMSPRLPPGAGSSTLKELFEAWGIEFDTEKFIGDRASAVRVSAQVRGRDVRVRTGIESLSGLKVPRVALPKLESESEILRFRLLENLPGHFPFTAGLFPFRREAEAPKRMFAGEGPPSRTNERFHYLSAGEEAKRLSTAFDSLTLYGEDPNERPDIWGKVGESGVSVCTLDDMKILYSGFDLCSPSTSVSMTIKGPAPIILAMFLNTATDQQVDQFEE